MFEAELGGDRGYQSVEQVIVVQAVQAELGREPPGRRLTVPTAQATIDEKDGGEAQHNRFVAAVCTRRVFPTFGCHARAAARSVQLLLPNRPARLKQDKYESHTRDGDDEDE